MAPKRKPGRQSLRPGPLMAPLGSSRELVATLPQPVSFFAGGVWGGVPQPVSYPPLGSFSSRKARGWEVPHQGITPTDSSRLTGLEGGPARRRRLTCLPGPLVGSRNEGQHDDAPADPGLPGVGHNGPRAQDHVRGDPTNRARSVLARMDRLPHRPRPERRLPPLQAPAALNRDSNQGVTVRLTYASTRAFLRRRCVS